MDWMVMSDRPGFNFPDGSLLKDPPASTGATGEAGSMPRLGRSPGEGNGNPLQYSCLEESDETEQLSACTHTHTHVHTHVSDVCLALGAIHGSGPWFPSLECNTYSA